MKEPEAEYLTAIGAEKSELGGPQWVEEKARSVGLQPEERWVATREEWDNYEDALLRGIETFVAANPQDAEGKEMLAAQRAFHAAQVRWGRETMGFAVELVRRVG